MPSKSSSGVAFNASIRGAGALAHQLGGARGCDDVRVGVEGAGAVDVVAVPVAEHDGAHRPEALGRGAQLAGGGERDVRVEDERLAAEVDEAGVSDGDAVGLGDRRVHAVVDALDLRGSHAVLRSRASCSRRRMIGFASLTISSR